MYQEEDNQITILDEDMLRIEAEIEREKKATMIMNKINLMYKQVIENFQSAGMPIYRPEILSKMTRKKFIDWILRNNEEIVDLF